MVTEYKKLLEFGLVALLVAVMLFGSGCRKEDDGSGEGKTRAKLVIALPSRRRDRAFYKREVEKFQQAHPGVEVVRRHISGDYYRKVLVMIAGGVAPDLMWMGRSFAEFAQRGAFLDVSDRIARDISTEEFLPESLEWYTFGEKQYGVPIWIDVNYLVYNKRLFDEAGLDYPSDDWTYPEFIEAAQALTIDRDGDGKIDQYGYWGALIPPLFKASFIDPDGPRATCDTPEMLDYIRTNYDLVNKYKTTPSLEDKQQQGFESYTLFVQEKAAMMPQFTWDLPTMREKYADMDWDICMYPKVRRRATWASSGAIVISRDTQHPDLAWELCKRFTTKSFQKKLAYRSLPANMEAAREYIASYNRDPKNYEILYKARKYFYPDPRVPRLQEYQNVWSQQREAAFLGRSEPKEAMRRAQRDLEYLIRKNQENKF